jgi:DNA adenine methylase
MLISERLNAADARITDLDFAALIEDTSRRAVMFLDPPYFDSGSNYRHDCKPVDHFRLAALLRKTPHPWVLTYHDCPEVRRLYVWATITGLYAKTVIIKGG